MEAGDLMVVVLGVAAIAALLYDEWDCERMRRERHAQIDNEQQAERLVQMGQEPGARSEEL